MKKDSKLRDYLVLRRRAVALQKQGKKQTEIADVLGVRQSTVSGWLKQYRNQGEASLGYPKIGGSLRRINIEQQEQLVNYLKQGAQMHGYDGDLWTQPRVQHLIQTKFALSYSVRAVGNLLRDLGFTCQKPVQRNYHQQAVKVKEWKEKRLPEIKKSY